MTPKIQKRYLGCLLKCMPLLFVVLFVPLFIGMLAFVLHQFDAVRFYSATPGRVFDALFLLPKHGAELYCTLYLAFKGLVCGSVLAFLVGAVLALSPNAVSYWVHLINAIRAVPMTLLIPFLITLPVVLPYPPLIKQDIPSYDPAYLIALGTFIYILIGIAEGIGNRNREREAVFKKIYHFSSAKYLYCVLIPEIMPPILTAARLATLMSFVLAIVFEQLTQYPGIGRCITQKLGDSSRGDNNAAEALALLGCVCFVGIVIDALFVYVRKTFISWDDRVSEVI